jgi:hypothetical protein
MPARSPAKDGVVYYSDHAVKAIRVTAAFKDEEQWTCDMNGDIFGSPVLHDGILFVSTGAGELFAFDAAGKGDQKPLIDARPLFDGGGGGAEPLAFASLTLAGRYLFLTSNQGDSVVLEATREAKLVSKNRLPAGSGAAPVFSGKRHVPARRRPAVLHRRMSRPIPGSPRMRTHPHRHLDGAPVLDMRMRMRARARPPRRAMPRAADTTTRAVTGALGSPGFTPTPDHPIGWRGDGSGSYPAASPPLEWFRKPLGAFDTLRSPGGQAQGAGGRGPAAQHGLDPRVAGRRSVRGQGPRHRIR